MIDKTRENYIDLIVTTTLYRPVGPKKQELIKKSNWPSFPSRLGHQPIFYPVLNQEYAEQIAKNWNVKI